MKNKISFESPFDITLDVSRRRIIRPESVLEASDEERKHLVDIYSGINSGNPSLKKFRIGFLAKDNHDLRRMLTSQIGKPTAHSESRIIKIEDIYSNYGYDIYDAFLDLNPLGFTDVSTNVCKVNGCGNSYISFRSGHSFDLKYPMFNDSYNVHYDNQDNGAHIMPMGTISNHYLSSALCLVYRHLPSFREIVDRLYPNNHFRDDRTDYSAIRVLDIDANPDLDRGILYEAMTHAVSLVSAARVFIVNLSAYTAMAQSLTAIINLLSAGNYYSSTDNPVIRDFIARAFRNSIGSYDDLKDCGVFEQNDLYVSSRSIDENWITFTTAAENMRNGLPGISLRIFDKKVYIPIDKLMKAKTIKFKGKIKTEYIFDYFEPFNKFGGVSIQHESMEGRLEDVQITDFYRERCDNQMRRIKVSLNVDNYNLFNTYETPHYNRTVRESYLSGNLLQIESLE